MAQPRRGVLLDVDGTLVDNSYFHAVAWYRALRDAGESRPMALLHRLVGMGSDMYTRELFGRERSDLADGHSRHIAPMFDEMSRLPGARELLERIHSAGLQVVLATSAKSEDLERLLKIIDADGLIDHTTSSGDVETSKPAPDIVAAALEGSGLRAEDAVFVGDTRWDVEAAGRAGVRCVAVETGGWSPHELREAGAVAVYRDAAQMVAEFDATPIAELATR